MREIKDIELKLLDDLIGAINKNKEGYFTKEEIIKWLERQKYLIKKD